VSATVLRIRDLWSIAFLTSGSRIRDGRNPNLDPGSGINIPDHISESLESIFDLKYLNSLLRIRDPVDLGSGIWDGVNLDPG
jgi:hypothetical protein